jgi:PTS system cellobiose-specific IIA component
MELNNETAAFMIISKGGDASSKYFKAFERAQKGFIEEAKELCELARVELEDAHKIQTKIIQAESRGEGFDLGVLMVHAQDHLMNAMLVKEMAIHIIYLYEQVNTGGSHV